jgi:hypothetical protein
MYQHFKDRASRMQSESLLPGFAETPPIMERSSKIAQVECNQDHFLSFDDAKVDKPRNCAKLRA